MIENKFKENILNGFEEILIRKQWKIIFPIIFSIIAKHLWEYRELLFSIFPFDNTNIIYPYIRVMIFCIYGIILILGVLQVFVIIGKTTGNTLKKEFKASGITNKAGTPANLIRKRKDKNKKYGIIYEFFNPNVSMNNWRNLIPDLETILNSKIYQVSFGKNTHRVLIYAIPKKYAKPTTISVNDNPTIEGSSTLAVGNTGSGKSYYLLTTAGSCARTNPYTTLIICDYKKSSFAQFEDTKNFYGYADVPNGIKTAYKEFTERLQANDEERNKKLLVLIIDEYGALISALDKKIAEEIKTMVGNMLFMGRSLGIKVIIGIQRADSEYFKSGARDQFKTIVGLGNLSKEQKQMLFSEYKDEMTDINHIGEGYMLIDGKGIERIKVAEIEDFNSLNEVIRKSMNR